jgi:hypothetical protein
MSKKTKQNKKEEKQEFDSKANDILESKQEEPLEVMPDMDVQKFNCSEAAEKLIVGYSSRWLPSLKSFAKQNAMEGDYSLDEWKELYIKWGAKIK